MNPRTPPFRRVVAVAVMVLLVGCATESPSPTPSPDVTPVPSPSPAASPSPTVAPTPTPFEPTSFPLAVVTGLTNLKAAITLDELAALADSGELVVPCGVQIEEPSLTLTAPCLAAPEIAASLEEDQARVALLPPGLVEPATKVLRISGDGPFGLFGPDLFGDPEARAMSYPLIAATTADDPELDPDWIAHDPSEIWNMTSIGSLCSDRGGSYQAVTLGKGWEWVFNGGTAEYAAPAVVDPPEEGPYIPVQPIETGNDGVTPAILERSDLAFADHECPILPSETWVPNISSTSFAFSVPEDVLPYWRDLLGIDLVYLAANHMSDHGVEGIRSSLQLLDEYGIPQTGLGMNLDEALEPAYLEVAGLTVAFVAHNDVPGVFEATADSAGVPWITEENINESVRRAQAGGADLIICAPQWWGGAEYHHDLWPLQRTQLEWFDAAGCDHVVGAGTHVVGPLLLDGPPDDVRLVMASPGNYAFGQNWWQATQEGVIVDMTFRGTTLVNVRFHPTVQVLNARPALLDPEGDGHYVLERIWLYAEVEFTR
jgi:hypothetical protein